MEVIELTTRWVKGEVLQGKIGLVIGFLIGIAFLNFADFQHPFYKGMIIPFVILEIVLLGYSSYQLVMRPKYIVKVEQVYIQRPQSALEMQLKKSRKDDLVYRMIRILWVSLLLGSLLFAFLLNHPLYKGMSIGFAGFFFVAYFFDTILHLRLKIYLKTLQQL
ncbi:hypothetical protein [Peijinzhouia sedimentorum]